MSTGQQDHPPSVDVAALHRRLLAERDSLRDVSAASADTRDPVALDQASVGRLSRMDAMNHQAMAMATERRRVAALQRIEAALARLETGDYGWCAQCGEPIAPARLALDPATPTCIACAGQPKR
ncbi:MAG TPA: TraR/DksA family transcriptional regulator [Falsiroseomonas sp.]|jgi:DnaK suppressor protein|nr:TraR/DksA family transcriptional regulator [Falsiroseomonas sp.]